MFNVRQRLELSERFAIKTFEHLYAILANDVPPDVLELAREGSPKETQAEKVRVRTAPGFLPL